jgi:predicted Zn-dependent peptidase
MEHEVTEHVLSSGTRGLVINVPGTSVLNLEVEFNSGFMFGRREKYEIPHVLEHILAGDTKFVIEAEKNGAYRNAMTSSHVNGYVYECADFEKERIMGLLGRQLTAPNFSETELKKEVGAVAEELSRNLANYPRLAYFNLAARTMPKRALQEDRRLKQLPLINLQDVKEYYEQTHTRKNMHFYFSGDLPDGGKDLIKDFESYIAQLPEGRQLKAPQEPIRRLNGPLLLKKPIPQVHYLMQTYAGPLGYRQRLAASTLRALMTGGYRSWLFGAVRQQGLAYHVATGFWTDDVMSSFDFSAYATQGNIERVFELFTGNYTKALEGNFTEKELEETLVAMKGRLLRSNQTPLDLLNWYSGPYSQENVILRFEQFLDDLGSVTKEEVISVARTFVEQQHWGLSLVGNIDKSQAQKLYDILKPIWSNR